MNQPLTRLCEYSEYQLLNTEDICTALLSAADTGVNGFTGVAVAALVSGGTPDGAKLTPNVDVSALVTVSGAVDVSFVSGLSVDSMTVPNFFCSKFKVQL